MSHLFRNSERSVVVGSALVIAAVTGWGASAYSAIRSGGELSAAIAERDAGAAKHQRLEAAVADLAQVEAKVSVTRGQYAQAVQGLAELRVRLGAAQQELAALTKRVQQARDQVSQTGSIKQAEPPKRPMPTR